MFNRETCPSYAAWGVASPGEAPRARLLYIGGCVNWWTDSRGAELLSAAQRRKSREGGGEEDQPIQLPSDDLTLLSDNKIFAPQECHNPILG